MPLTLLRHATQKPPIGPLKLDIGHPLSSGLLAAWIINDFGSQTLFDYAGGLYTTAPRTGLYVWNNSSGGPSIRPASGAECGLTPLFPFTTTMTFACRVMTENTGGSTQNFFGEEVDVNTQMRVGDVGSALVNFHFNNTQLNSVTSLVNNQMYSLAGTYDGATQSLYIDGKLDASQALVTTLNQNRHMGIGGRWNGSTVDRLLQGPLVYLYVWNRALSQADARRLALEPYAMWQTRPLQRWFVVAAAFDPATLPYTATQLPTPGLALVGF